jgi:hypothetical protein
MRASFNHILGHDIGLIIFSHIRPDWASLLCARSTCRSWWLLIGSNFVPPSRWTVNEMVASIHAFTHRAMQYCRRRARLPPLEGPSMDRSIAFSSNVEAIPMVLTSQRCRYNVSKHLVDEAINNGNTVVLTAMLPYILQTTPTRWHVFWDCVFTGSYTSLLEWIFEWSVLPSTIEVADIIFTNGQLMYADDERFVKNVDWLRQSGHLSDSFWTSWLHWLKETAIMAPSRADDAEYAAAIVRGSKRLKVTGDGE